jgi:hypothetical protein
MVGRHYMHIAKMKKCMFIKKQGCGTHCEGECETHQSPTPMSPMG